MRHVLEPAEVAKCNSRTSVGFPDVEPLVHDVCQQRVEVCRCARAELVPQVRVAMHLGDVRGDGSAEVPVVDHVLVVPPVGVRAGSPTAISIGVDRVVHAFRRDVARVGEDGIGVVGDASEPVGVAGQPERRHERAQDVRFAPRQRAGVRRAVVRVGVVRVPRGDVREVRAAVGCVRRGG